MLIDYPIHIDTLYIALYILYFKGLSVKMSKNVFLIQKIFFVLVKRKDTEEMLPYFV